MSIVAMTHFEKIGIKSPLEKWLFDHDLSARAAAPLFKTNRSTMANIAAGKVPAAGLTRELIAAALLGEMSIAELQRIAEPRPTRVNLPAPGNLPAPQAANSAAAGPLAGED